MLTFYQTKTLIKQIFKIIYILIKHKGQLTITMQEDDFNKHYHIYNDDIDYIINTNLISLLFDIETEE